jgi:hypothetical protein
MANVSLITTLLGIGVVLFNTAKVQTFFDSPNIFGNFFKKVYSFVIFFVPNVFAKRIICFLARLLPSL